MTPRPRKRIKKSLTRFLCEPCFYCDGEGYLISRQSVCYNIYREVLREAIDMSGAKLTLRVNPEIAELLHGEENHIVLSLERITGKQINIYPNSNVIKLTARLIVHVILTLVGFIA